MLITTLTNLLLINIIMTLIHESGFIENVDDWISDKYKFHHLPYPVRCLLCSVNWLSIFYVLITGNLSLFTLFLCLLNAHLTEVVRPLFRFVMNVLLKIVELLNKLID